MQLSDKIFDYLKSKLVKFEHTKKMSAHLFTCPNLANHKWEAKSPTATFISGSDKISCLNCGWKGTFFDAVRLLESEKSFKSDAEITNYLMSKYDVDTYSELEDYVKYGWTLVPIAKNSKNPIEDAWTSKTHYDKIDWIKWLNNGLNVGLRTGDVSKITVIDVDLKVNPSSELEALFKELNDAETLVQNTPHGLHFVFKYDKEIPQTVKIAGMTIDTRNDGGQIVIQPSKLDNLNYHWKNLGTEIKVIPKELKDKILDLLKLKGKDLTVEHYVEETISTEPLKLKNNNLEGCCNDTFVQLGGGLIKFLTPDQTEKVLYMLNKALLENPMEPKAIKAMLNSLTGYKEGEETTIEQTIYNYLKQMQTVHTRDIVDSLKLDRGICDKYLSKFAKEGRAIRLGKGFYQCKEAIQWQKGGIPDIVEYRYRVPLFNDIATFQDGDVLILGGVPNSGKTTIAMNMIREMVAQGVEPYYLFSESGSRYQLLAKKFDIADKYYWKESLNPLTIELAEDSFTVIDWLDFGKEGFEKTAVVLEYLATEMRKKRGILVIFTQLKPESHDWFAPNLIEQYPTLSAKYVQDSEDKSFGHWDVRKIKEPKGNFTTYTLACEFNHDTKIFQIKSLI